MVSCIFITWALFFFGNSVGSTEDTLRFVTVTPFKLILSDYLKRNGSNWEELYHAVRQLFRHGDRSPLKAYPNDLHKEKEWPQGFGQLSPEGMTQHFHLGQFLRKRYTDFLSKDYSHFEIAVQSSDYDRTIMSAASNLAGLYYNGSRMIDPGLLWQPIPIHTDEEKLLSFPIKNCPRYELLMNETENSEIYKEMTDKYSDFLKMVQRETGLDSISLRTVGSVYDTLSAEEHNNLSLPYWVTPKVMKTLKELNDFSYAILFGIYKREEKSRLQGGVLLDQIIKNLSAAATSNPPQQLKMIMYSAHDTTILALQEALNVYNGLVPPFASCHIFELHQDPDGSFSVKMFYHNEISVDEPHDLTLPGCDHQCPLQDFIDLTRSVIPTNWQKECNKLDPVDLCSFLDNWIPEVLGNMSSSAHSIRSIQRPRMVIITLFNYKKQQKTLNVARRKEDMRYVNPRVIFFPDLSAETLQNRQYFARVKALFRELARCGMRAHVIIKYNKKCMSFKTTAEAEAYIQKIRA